MEYNRPDNINDTLSATLIQRKDGVVRNMPTWSVVLLLILLLIL